MDFHFQNINTLFNTISGRLQQFSKGIKLLEIFVFIGCCAMLVIQIGLSGMDYLAFKTVPTIHKDTLLDIFFPRIVICLKEAFNIDNSELRQLITGIKAYNNKSFQFQGWGGETNMDPFQYL